MEISQPVSNYVPLSLLTTQGDLLIQGAAAAERLPIGAIDLVLTSQGAGANPSWQDPLKLITTQGDIIIRGAAGAERLAIGATDLVLTSQGAGANPSWQDPLKILTTQGDIVKRGAAGAERLAKGTTRQILRTNVAGTDIEWEENSSFYANQLGVQFQIRFYEIGDWDMDTDATKNVAHGVTASNIIFVTAWIRDDSDTQRIQINGGAGGAIDGWADWTSTSSTNIRLNRTTGGHFDSANFNATSYNRGWVIALVLL